MTMAAKIDEAERIRKIAEADEWSGDMRVNMATIHGALRSAVKLIDEFRDAAPGMHYRRCWSCENVAAHVDSVTPWVLCRKCGSPDTRLIRPTKGEA